MPSFLNEHEIRKLIAARRAVGAKLQQVNFTLHDLFFVFFILHKKFGPLILLMMARMQRDDSPEGFVMFRNSVRLSKPMACLQWAPNG